MTVRLVFGPGCSLLTGLAGGWLVTAPWVLGEQGSGGWTTVTKTEFGAGLGAILAAASSISLIAVLAHATFATGPPPVHWSLERAQGVR
jgi:hypothetical protein